MAWRGTALGVTVPPHDTTAYGRAFADLFDDLYSGVLDTEAAVRCLGDLAEGGPVLELGVGTGRLALPLAATGLAVHGVDASPEMLDALRAKPGSAGITVEQADFTEFSVDQRFSLAVLAFNTLFALPDQDAQVACFASVGRHLRPGGRFVIEAWVPDVGRFRAGRAVQPLVIGADRVVVEVAELDAVHQRMRTTKILSSADGVRLLPANHRYAWPAELDLMARLAGLRLEHRWGDWTKGAFTGDSQEHISVYRKP